LKPARTDLPKKILRSFQPIPRASPAMAGTARGFAGPAHAADSRAHSRAMEPELSAFQGRWRAGTGPATRNPDLNSLLVGRVGNPRGRLKQRADGFSSSRNPSSSQNAIDGYRFAPPILRASMQRSLSRRTCGVASVRCQVRLRFTDCAMTE
jgi:hypothetical protein